MRIWNQNLIPLLCRNHLLGCWREGLGCYKIVTGQVDGGSYKNHPQVKEFRGFLPLLRYRLISVRKEMIKRGYKPKKLPFETRRWIGSASLVTTALEMPTVIQYQPWQSLNQQIKILRKKECECRV